MRTVLDHPRRVLRTLAAALLLAAAAPAGLGAQAFGIGFFGLGLGTRTGFSFSAGVQVTDQVQVICKVGGITPLNFSRSCGAHLYLMNNPDWFYVAEVGEMSRAQHPVPTGAWTEKRFFFVQGGAGWRDHELTDDDGDDEPEYSRSLNVSWSAGLSLVLAKFEQEVTLSEDGEEIYGRRRFSPSIWPLFFWDAQVEAYLPGRDCRKC